MRIAVVNGALYEAAQHEPIALKEGLTQAKIHAFEDWPASGLFDATERAVLALTRQVQVPDEHLQRVRTLLGEKETLELVATVAAYNMVSRFLEALDIHADDKR